MPLLVRNCPDRNFPRRLSWMSFTRTLNCQGGEHAKEFPRVTLTIHNHCALYCEFCSIDLEV